jgi:hypothetical protein
MDVIWTLLFILLVMTGIFAGLVSTKENLSLKQRHRAKYIAMATAATIVILVAIKMFRMPKGPARLWRAAAPALVTKPGSVPVHIPFASHSQGPYDSIVSPEILMSPKYLTSMETASPTTPAITLSMPLSMQSTRTEDSILPSIFLDFASPSS